jgi:hypothetical protein
MTNESHADESGLNILRTPVYGFTAWKMIDEKEYAAGAGTTFYIVRRHDSKVYVIFDDEDEITEAPPNGTITYERVSIRQIYEIEKSELLNTYRMRWGIAHGPLVVPFKYRTADGTLSGESTLGYYLGVKSETILLSGTAFISAGLSLIPISDVNSQEAENRTGFSWAIGYALKTKTDFQAAIVAGSDHLGGTAGDNWKYEDDIWISLAIGFNFME